MVVRRLRRDEWQRLRDIRLRALADAPAALGEFLDEERGFPKEYWRSIAEDTQQGDRRVSVVAEEDGVLVGMVGGDFRSNERAVHLVALWVDPAVRGRGVGRALVDALVGWAQERGAVRVELWVVEDNPAAAAVYQAAGFVSSGTRQVVPYAPDSMETLLVRPLVGR
jgi:ribosomal protein S18 acetylase RimI-like enzyme